mgnify:CR=1 FL=1|jgi:hypothetical protein|tara:strand:+ start:18 stop:362 length:345 start_codon:yes stop_codon:yes gene_type:complete
MNTQIKNSIKKFEEKFKIDETYTHVENMGWVNDNEKHFIHEKYFRVKDNIYSISWSELQQFNNEKKYELINEENVFRIFRNWNIVPDLKEIVVNNFNELVEESLLIENAEYIKI